MDYSKMTKAELIEKLEEQKHLASAIEAKDKEIIGFIKKIEDLKQLQKGLVPEEKIKELNKKINELNVSYAGSVKKEALEGYTKALEEERDNALKIANQYIIAHRDYLKLTKQALDMAIFTEELISPKK